MSKHKVTSCTHLSAMSILWVRQTASDRAMEPFSFTKKLTTLSTSRFLDQDRLNRFGKVKSNAPVGLLPPPPRASADFLLPMPLTCACALGPISMPCPVVDESNFPLMYSLNVL